jgi:hypothetical protein
MGAVRPRKHYHTYIGTPGGNDAVTDRMKYGIKPSAVTSESTLHNFKAVNGRSFTQTLGNEIVFEFPGMGSGNYCDFSTSYFRFGVNCALTAAAVNDYTAAATNAITQNAAGVIGAGYVRFDRGPESIFRRVQIFDSSGNLLENFENYNDLYCATELMTNNSTLRSMSGTFHGEGLMVPQNNAAPDASGGLYDLRTNAAATGACVGNPFEVRPTGYNPQLPYVRYPDLGGIIAGQHSTMQVAVNANAGLAANAQVDISNFQQSTQCIPIGTTSGPNDIKYFTFQLISSMFGGSSDKYLPMSAINGLRIVFTLEDQVGAFVTTGLGAAVGATAQPAYTANIIDPTLFLNMVQVDPNVDAALKATATGPDGKIRISSQTWSTYQTSIPANSASFEFIIPNRVSSLKAIYFTFSKQGYTGLETWADYLYPRIGMDSRTTWFDNCLTDYQFYLDGKPFPFTPVSVKTGYSEALSELQRSLHIGHKGADGNYLSLLCNGSLADYTTRNFILGHEFESFNGKGPVIESGFTTLTSTLSLRLNFDTAGTKKVPSGARVGGNSYAAPPAAGPVGCYLKVFCLYDAFLSLEDQTGIMRVEF